ncbi:MAG TPA: hypothetical protein VGE35_00975 [Candidatus Paceibacterota bacterium]
MTCRRKLVWCIVRRKEIGGLSQRDRLRVTQLIDELFPGIYYRCGEEFNRVLQNWVVPVLAKRYPELEKISDEAIQPSATDTIDIKPHLPANGREWQEIGWQHRFRELLAA